MATLGTNRPDVLVLVAGHAIYLGETLDEPESDHHWCLQEFQRGEPPFYIEHIRAGVELAARDDAAVLVFSGGQTRQDAGPRSEGASYLELAQQFGWWTAPGVERRAVAEEFARDSFENLLFGICRFHEATGTYPRLIHVVSWQFKEARFNLHRAALRFPAERFQFVGVNQPVDLAGAQAGEAQAVAAFTADPYGSSGVLARKRADRDPFRRRHAYDATCPDLEGLLGHPGTEPYTGPLPW